MKVVVLVIVAIMLMLASFSLVQAVGLDDRGNPNDPKVNERANACFEGGSLDGKCVTDAEWNAGWYLIRFQQGIIAREEFPDFYAWILPPIAPIAPTATAPTILPTPTLKPL